VQPPKIEDIERPERAPSLVEATTVLRLPAQLGHLYTLDALRGIASLAVCWFHLTCAEFYEQFGTYAWCGKYGWLGVQIFFVISGFVIPFSMHRSGYRVRAFFKFILKRLARLDPPYLVSIAFVLTGYYLSSRLPGHAPFHVHWKQVAAHLGYVNAFLGMGWLQMTYWSLAVEFQYYIFVGLCFPLFVLRKKWAPAAIVASFALVSLLVGKNDQLLPHFLPLFALGILAFRYRRIDSQPSQTVPFMALAAALAVYVDGWLQGLVGATTCAIIVWVKIKNPILTFLGNISYSLYLMHVFVGYAVYGLILRHFHLTPWVRYTAPWVTLTAALVTAYLLNVLVELPSRDLAAKLSYTPRPKRPMEDPKVVETHAH
jgi:peptidoglycan/LPS O-acetylase OafA/YrhL